MFIVTISRSQQISLDHTPYYHCTTRCVRQAFLCGRDELTGRNFEHRRQWVAERLAMICQAFAIDLVAYAVMSNHYHVVVRINATTADTWRDREVINRWQLLYSLPDCPVSAAHIDLWRSRLKSLSWFMRAVNEPIARRANREDRCKGRFWEGRFRCQALLDESALIRCMAYVDLNPVRAKVAESPETSSFTSLCARLAGNGDHLMPFHSNVIDDKNESIPITYEDYLQLVDWTGRALSPGKRGVIPTSAPPILTRLGMERDEWVKEMRYYGKWYYRAVGPLQALRDYCDHLGQEWLKGMGTATQSVP